MDVILSTGDTYPYIKEYLLQGCELSFDTRQVYSILDPFFQIYFVKLKNLDKGIFITCQSRYSVSEALNRLEKEAKNIYNNDSNKHDA